MSGTNIYTINETYSSDAFSEWPWNVELSKGKNTREEKLDGAPLLAATNL